MNDQHVLLLKPVRRFGANPQGASATATVELVRDAVGTIRRASREGRLSTLQIEAAAHLALDALQVGLYEEAIDVAEELLVLDPCHERACEVVVRARMALNDRSGASDAYRRYRAAIDFQRLPVPSGRLQSLVYTLLREIYV